MSSFRWISWTQPIVSSNTDYGAISASSQNASSVALPWKAADGIHEGSNTSWESARDAIPAWWKWSFPVTLRITHLMLYNKYSSYSHLSKNASVYADADMGRRIGQGKFAEESFSMLDIEFSEPVVTDTLWIVCESGYMPSNTFVGLGEVEITAEEGVALYDVQYLDWDGTVLKSETVEYGGSVTPPSNPVREGYSFDGWSEPTGYITQDTTVHALYTRVEGDDRFLLTTLKTILVELSIPVETGVFSGTPPACYAVLTPLTDSFELFADNHPLHEVQEIRISLFDKGNYLRTRNRIVEALLASEITITDRRYITHEDDTGYHHSAIDVAQVYNTEE